MKRTVRYTTALVISLLPLACAGPDVEGTHTAAEAASESPLAAYEPDAARRAQVVGTLQHLFDALETGDADLLRSVMDPSVVMHSSETRDGMTTFGRATLEELATRITSSEVRLIERMWEPVVVTNGPMATIWTPYDFYVGSDFSHCGVDVATMMQTDEGWTIVALSWTRLQPPSCDLHPDGPPA
jgi:hypothetical protein